MERGKLVIVCLGVLVLGAGCLSEPQSPLSSDHPSSTNAPSNNSAPQFPSDPMNLSQDSVVKYAEAYERAAKYQAVHEPGAEVTLTCDAILDKATDSGYYVVAACGGSVTHPDGQHGDIAPTEHAYFINETETIRIDPTYLEPMKQEDIYTAENESENLYRPAGLNARGFKVLNFGDSPHTVSVEVAYLNESATQRVFSQSYSVNGRDGVVQPGVTARKGKYKVSVMVENGTTTTFGWHLSEERLQRVAIVLTRDGEVEVRPADEPEMG